MTLWKFPLRHGKSNDSLEISQYKSVSLQAHITIDMDTVNKLLKMEKEESTEERSDIDPPKKGAWGNIYKRKKSYWIIT